jgi:hypothetical protein
VCECVSHLCGLEGGVASLAEERVDGVCGVAHQHQRRVGVPRPALHGAQEAPRVRGHLGGEVGKERGDVRVEASEVVEDLREGGDEKIKKMKKNEDGFKKKNVRLDRC